MTLSAFALAAAIAACAPKIHPITVASISFIEDGARDAYAIHDNATTKSYLGLSQRDAIALATQFVADGPDSERCQIAARYRRSCTIDVGPMQLNSSNFAGLGITVAQAFDPATNVWYGSQILRSAWHSALQTTSDRGAWAEEVKTYSAAPDARQVLLRSAFSIYNSNSAWNSASYAQLVVDASTKPTVRRIAARAMQLRGRIGPCRAGMDFEAYD